VSAPLFDTHCHLAAEAFDGDRAEVVERARAEGVAAALVVSEDLGDAERVLEVAGRHPDFIVPAIGVHPDRAPLLDDAEVEAVLALARAEASRLGAIGEVGLDWRPRWDEAARARQVEVLRAFVALADELDLPLTVHSRSAGRHAIAALLEAGARAACLHAFDGRPAHAERGAGAGFLFSIPPSIVRSEGKRKLARRLGVESLLLESDSPVLGPDREARNEPANVRLALAAVAAEKGASPDELAETLARNTERLLPRLAALAP
jgi:TatD DNase family protein